jgi:hypothetical protein
VSLELLGGLVSMSVEWAGSTVIVRKDSQSPALGLAYLFAGAAVTWMALASSESQGVGFAGVALGLYLAWLGVGWLSRGRGVLRLDTNTRQLHHVSYGFLGAKYVQKVDFTEVASVGTGTFKDPRNGAVWAVETVLRLKDGRRLPAGAPSDADRVGGWTGLLVDHKVIWEVEPQVASA